MKKDSKSELSTLLRQKAEELLKKKPAKPGSILDEDQIFKLIHELEVHQIELELQNQELLLEKAQITAQAEKYAELYDFAPSGYFTLSNNGEILELNLCGSQMLGKDRTFLISKMFGLYVSDDSKPIFNRFLDKVFSSKLQDICEVALQVNNNLPMYVHLSGSVTENGEQCLIIAMDITERKQAEAALRESEKQYTSLFNNFHNSVAVHQIVLDEAAKPVDYIFIQVNEAFTRQTGLRMVDVLGKRVTEVIPGIEKTSLIDIYGKVAITGEPIIFEQYFEPLGRYFHISAFRVGEGRFCTVFQDITERQRIGKVIEDQHALLTALINSPKDIIIFSLDRNYCYTTFNEKHKEEMKRIWDVDIAVGMNLLSCMPKPELQKLAKQSIDRALRGESFSEIQHQPEPDIYFEFSWNPIKQNNEAVGVTVFIRDITVEKKAEELIRKSEERYRGLMTNLEAGVVVHAPDTSIIMNNHRASELLGLSDDQMKGRLAIDPDWKFVDKDGIPLPVNDYPVNRIIASKRPFSNVLFGVVQPENGNIVWLAVNGFPGFDDQGKIAEVLISFNDITERKLAEEALVQNRDLLANLARLVPGVIYQYRLYPDGRSAFPYASPGMNDIYEVTPEEVQKDATPVFGRLHHEDYDHVVEAIQESARTLNTFYCEYRVNLPRQGIRWRWSQAQPIRLEDGSILWHGIISDITERKLAEQTLLVSEQKFRETVTNLDEGYYSVSLDGVLLEHNQAFCRILGFDSTADLKGIRLPDFWQHPDERKKYLEVISANDSISNYQINILSRTGEKRSVLANAHLVKDENGLPLRIEGVFLDITDRIRMEESLQRHTERIQNLHKIDKTILSEVETPEAIIQKTLQHIRSLLSSQHASIGMFDFKKETLQLFSSNIRDQSIDVAKKYLFNNALGDLEILREKKMDVVENISLGSLPPDLQRIFQSEGITSCINVPLISGEKLIGVMNLGWEDPRAFTPEELEIAGEVADEITVAIEQVRLRQAAKHYAEELEKRVEERTSQLLAANKELEAFSYSVSHDLRAPLRHINGYISILSKHLKDILPEKEKHYFDTIADSAHQMGKLIDDLLHFSRTGRQEMQLTSLDMNVVLKDALQVIQHESFGRGIKWVVAGLPPVTGDYALLRLVWLNLLSNAVKFGRANVIPQIEIGIVDTSNEFVFFVRDNGVGFDMQYAHKLFGVFERLHSAQEFEGTGIGLANVRRIIQRHGGRTWAEAEVGKGATFYFSLPKG